jgi:ATP-binding cassette subfamily F protein uup
VIREYVGGYTDYLNQRPRKDEPKAVEVKKAAEPARTKTATKLSYKDSRELEELPGRLDKLTQEIAKLEAELADSQLYTRDRARFDKSAARVDAARAELEAAEERWLELEALREELGR